MMRWPRDGPCPISRRRRARRWPIRAPWRSARRTRATSRTSSARSRCRSAWPGRCASTALYAHGDYYVPLATTEAALVASYSRGAQLITEAGGCTAVVLNEGVSRAPGFAFETLGEAALFVAWAARVVRGLSRPRRRNDAARQARRHAAHRRRQPRLPRSRVHRPATPRARTW